MITGTISCALRITAVIVVSTMLSQGAHSAQLQRNGPRNAIVGSWIETITPSGPAAPPPFKSVGVFNEDGTSVFSDQGGVRSNPPQVFSSAVGSWVHLRDRTFAWTHVVLMSDFDGNFTGTVKIRGESTVDQSGNKYTARVHVDIADPNGNVFFSGDGTIEAQRIMVEPLQ